MPTVPVKRAYADTMMQWYALTRSSAIRNRCKRTALIGVCGPSQQVARWCGRFRQRAAALQIVLLIDYDGLGRARPLRGRPLLQLHAGRTR
jgi:hypothetical protein